MALDEGGWIVFASYDGHHERSCALAELRTIRSGGAVLSDTETVALLTAAGLRDARVVAVTLGVAARLVAARR